MKMKISYFNSLKCFFSNKINNLHFDHKLKKKQREFSLSISNQENFNYLRRISAERLIDRLDDINRDFEVALDLGCHNGHILNAINKQNDLSYNSNRSIGGITKLIQSDLISSKFLNHLNTKNQFLSSEYKEITTLEDEYKTTILTPNTYNLVVSSMWMHWANNVPGVLRDILSSLQPDGVFLGCMLGGSTLEEFRHVFYLAETERKGGVRPHMSPLTRPSDAAALLQSAGFALPTIDIDTITIRYPNVFVLMEHLISMGEGHATFNRNVGVGKETFLAMASAYQHMFSTPEGDIEATFQLISMIGWKPHESQPKPLKRGTATTSMTEIPTLVSSTSSSSQSETSNH